jgi:uncharacterized protein (DUF1501 family)
LNNGTYNTLRSNISLASTALNLGNGYGFHPSLVNLKTSFDQGRVAVINGVGYPSMSLSHFDAQAIWAGGTNTASAQSGTGWLGRYLDGLGSAPDSYSALSITGSVPLIMRGASKLGTAIPSSLSGAFGGSASATSQRLYTGVRAFAAAGQNSAWGDTLARSGVDTMTMATRLQPSYSGLPGGNSQSLALCAQLINANLGTRVMHTTLGNFDNHSSELSNHASALGAVDGAIKAFFDRLGAAWRSRVVLMVYSEFGRRPQSNVSAGTDHGTAAPVFLIGDNVNGGFHSDYPSLTNLDGNGNLRPTCDFRSIYATVLDQWLGADSGAVLGANYSKLDLFDASPGVFTPPIPPVPGGGYWMVSTAGKVTPFGTAAAYGDAPAGSTISTMVTRPQRDGYWLCAPNGKVFAFGNAKHLGDMSATPLNGSIVAMAASASGDGYWLVGSDGGIFSFGDAPFYGSTGNLKLVAPVVAMAATPTGKGYWFVATDGGVFSFGDAAFYGSMGGKRLNQPIVGMAASPTGKGYWLVASDGGIFSFGDAPFYGSTGSLSLAAPVKAMAPSRTGKGYWFVASDGGIFAFGDAGYNGSLAGSGQNIVAMGG